MFKISAMPKPADKKILRAVLEPRKDGALQKIADACAAGANPDGICPACSTSTGPVRQGSTLLTHSIHEWASKAVAKLLECGADPSLADQNGWTPWMASTLVDESKRDRIQDLLVQHGAEKSGDHIGQLVRAIADGRVDQVPALIKSDQDLEIVSSFRVDLVGHQIRAGNAQMLEFLLERKMIASSTNLINAIRSSNFAAVDLLLRYGMAPEDPDESETPLMTAAAIGDLKVVQRLVEAGADVNRSADNEGEWTASFYARQAGKKEVAQWLATCMSVDTLEHQDQVMAARDPRFRVLYERATAGESLSTDDIVEILQQWDEKYGVTVNDVEADRLTVSFSSLPEELDTFYNEILGLCPDASDSRRELLEELERNKSLFLWWD